MWYCEGCGHYFDEPDVETIYEWHSEVNATEGYKHWLCPRCGSEDLEEARVCELCEEPFVGRGEICPDCAKKIKDEVDRLAFELGHGEHKEIVDIIARYIGEEL